MGGKITKKGGWFTVLDDGTKFQLGGFSEYYEQNQERVDSWVEEISGDEIEAFEEREDE